VVEGGNPQRCYELGVVARRTQASAGFSEQARAIFPQVGDPDVVCDVMMSDGLLAIQRGDIDHARAAIEDALRLARDHSPPTLRTR